MLRLRTMWCWSIDLGGENMFFGPSLCQRTGKWRCVRDVYLQDKRLFISQVHNFTETANLQFAHLEHSRSRRMWLTNASTYRFTAAIRIQNIISNMLKTSGRNTTATTNPITRDQPNSRFHGRDIFREIGLLPWKTLISVKSVIFVNSNAFTFICEGF